MSFSLHVSPKPRVDDTHETNYYGSEARCACCLLQVAIQAVLTLRGCSWHGVYLAQLEAAQGQLEAARAQQQEADSLHSQLQTAQVRHKPRTGLPTQQ